MRRSLLLTSLLAHTLIVGGAIYLADDVAATDTEPASLFCQPSEATPLALQ